MRDLSQPIESGMQTYPGDPAVEISAVTTVPDDGAAVSELRCSSHAGTHIDAPSHTEPDGDSLTDRDVGEYVFDARFVDLTPCDPREAIEPTELPDTIELESTDLLVVRTGYDDHWNTDAYLDHPYLTPAAARTLRDADCGVATDTLSPDPTPTERASADEPDGIPAHRELLGTGLPILENLTNLERLPERFTLYAFPLPVNDGDASPVRAVADLE
ncbi:cyclase family protein [Natronobacterium gregoryi]|uniref:Cyclase n=2 Tax=Natronobacterium gregoryi TaxID=44930 RepID=L0AGV4_NATGS|nr:cyclase family protein [Natronobacterium gregoryi]AFZ72639.1 putative metal-dependent hydrolase [Natronobacterium gregoryi SP2]ELY69073.1 cyclase family protein [Natronobacterium gregoryi SP2]PLK19113.1 cyclase [Natronobacterium gregoryi SP2]SFI90399.1 Kynurenine formamidase [Natronobacterium gregoryi]